MKWFKRNKRESTSDKVISRSEYYDERARWAAFVDNILDYLHKYGTDDCLTKEEMLSEIERLQGYYAGEMAVEQATVIIQNA